MNDPLLKHFSGLTMLISIYFYTKSKSINIYETQKINKITTLVVADISLRASLRASLIECLTA